MEFRSNDRIKACCPQCLACPEKIVYQNSGPIIKIFCSECWLVYSETDAHKNGFKDVIDYWNHIGVYMPHD